ncbi:MAG: DUF86 domain-containing protein [Candidatus Brocadiaceae bacterium]|nr:DUF86 domain-containing protein [Candidatus Brocadiaceae bacterium]
MYDKELVLDILKNIVWSLDQINRRYQVIESSDDFIKDDVGLEKLDSICMQLINIGGALKQIDKLTEAKLLANYPEIDWKKAKGMRDIITHHYFDIDSETVFVVCSEHIPEMRRVIKKIIEDLEIEGVEK